MDFIVEPRGASTRLVLNRPQVKNALDTSGKAEGIRAFRERRKPRFTGQ